MYEAYSTSALAPRERFGSFEAVVARLFCPMQILPRFPAWQPFAGCVEAARLGSILLARVATSACAVRRRPQDIAQVSSAAYLVKFQLKGESLWSQRNREVHLRPGDFVVCSVAEPYSLQFHDPYEMPVLALPYDVMCRMTSDPDQFLGVRMGAEEADCGLLSSFVAQVVARMSHLSDPMIARVEANILDLLGGVLSARARHGTPTAAQQLGQIKQYITRHMHSRNLGPATIAAAFGVSTRHVHTLFEAESMTVGKYIRHLRTQECRRALEAYPADAMSLTDIALTWGFYDLSHMTRCFREEFGATPGELRAAAQRSR
jgi:AraC family transcriptional activator of tynA and feaB